VHGNPIDPTGWATAPAASPSPPMPAQGRGIDGAGTARESRVDLVSCEPFATGNPEAERWV
jgi:hypothetical protein